MTMLAAIQMVSTADVSENLGAASRLIEAAVASGAAIVSLPEYFCLMGAHDSDLLRIAEAPGQGPIQLFLADAARRYGIWLLGGTVPITTTGGTRVRNACCVFSPDGTLAARYDKIHLFAFDDGRDAYDEGTVLEAGDRPVSVSVHGVRVGLSVCYDLRFPELYRTMTFDAGQSPLDLISAPSAFTHSTGAKHWELLLRARAVENQCYVLAPAQGGVHPSGRRTWGHSMIIDPWGEIIACVAAGEGVAVAALDRERLSEVRTRLPALRHRRM